MMKLTVAETELVKLIRSGKAVNVTVQRSEHSGEVIVAVINDPTPDAASNVPNTRVGMGVTFDEAWRSQAVTSGMGGN